MLKIGPISVDPGILLAPMEDVSELPFRLICKELGADIVYTEFVNAEGLLREDPQGPRRSFRHARTCLVSVGDLRVGRGGGRNGGFFRRGHRRPMFSIPLLCIVRKPHIHSFNPLYGRARRVSSRGPFH